MSRHELTDEQWAVIALLIPQRQWRHGRSRNDDRRTVTGMLYVHTTGYTWNDLPKEYGSTINCWHRLTEWSRDRRWDYSWHPLRSHLDATGNVDWSRTFLDGSIVTVKKGRWWKVSNSATDMVVDGTGLPIGLQVTPAQSHERALVEPRVQTISVPRPSGRPTPRMKEMAADNANDSAALRRSLHRRSIKPTIPTIARRTCNRPQRGLPPHFGEGFRHRWIVKRCFSWMDNYRRLAECSDRHLQIYRASVLLRRHHSLVR